MISLRNDNFNYSINNFKLHRYENVLSYNYLHCKPEIEVNIQNYHTDKQEYYFIFDCPCFDAFAHWVYESFIFFPLYLELKSLYPDIKIITKNKKKYVKNLFTFFGEKNTIYNNFQSSNNICFFPHILCLNDHNIDQKLFSELIEQFKNFIEKKVENISFNDDGDILLLPRNTVDNFAPNDRIIHGLDDIEKNIIEAGGTSLNTYLCNNFNLQFSIIKNFKNIILDLGSSFYVNCIFLKGKNIIILDQYNYFWQIETFVSMRIMYDIIKSNNTLHIIRKNKTVYDDIKHLL